jgi:hypothetical protein
MQHEPDPGAHSCGTGCADARQGARRFGGMGPLKDAQQQFGIVNTNRYTLDNLIALSPDTPALQDDRPVNEYYFLRTPCSDCMPGVEYVRQRLYLGFGKFLHPGTVVASRQPQIAPVECYPCGRAPTMQAHLPVDLKREVA